MATRKSTARKPKNQHEFWNLTARDIFKWLLAPMMLAVVYHLLAS